MTPFFETVILTSRDRRAIHAEPLRKANPAMIFHQWESLLPPGATAWRNCDRNIRDFWSARRGTVAAESVLFLEWDVFANIDLLLNFTHPTSAVLGAAVKSPVTDRRTFLQFRELDRLPAWVAGAAIGLVPSAVLLMPRALLDRLVDDPRCEEAFSRDIISEIRLGSMARALGFSVGAVTGMDATVHTQPFQPASGARGIFHPVKKEVAA
jgi:hypothetical protein